jgi:hypothetical membrane protein
MPERVHTPSGLVRGIFLTTVICAAAYLVMTGVAIALFPGGTYHDPLSHGYSWTRNFFSDLGRSHAYGDGDITASRWLFSLSLTMVGLIFLPFGVAWRSVLQAKTATRVASLTGTIGAVTAGISYVVIAWTPWDLYLHIHTNAVYCGFGGLLLMSLSFGVAMALTAGYPRSGAVVMLALAAAALGYLYLLFFGPSYKTPTGLTIQVIGQKFIVASQVVVILFEAALALRMAKSGR